MFEKLETLPPDPILGLSVAFREDPSPDKVDLSVGVYKNRAGITPVMDAVRAAERELLDAQTTKVYLPPAGSPGFRERILARSVKPPQAMQDHDANYIGGDINGGVQDLFQFFTRPVMRINPYATPVKGLFICSSSTPPGGGVHGMCGYHAARAALCTL